MPGSPLPLCSSLLGACAAKPNKGSIIFSLSRENGGGERNEMKALAADTVNPGLETGEAAGERREGECRLWVTPNTFSQDRVPWKR